MTLAAADDDSMTYGAASREALTREEDVTRERLVADLRALGVPGGQSLLVHASLREIGRVDGGARTVVAALREVLGPTGTLVAGAGTPENSLTSRAFHAVTAGFTPQAIGQFCAGMPAYRRATTPTTIGAIAEALRTTPGAVRSAHPQSSFAAVGRQAHALMARHPVKCHLGERSPLGKLYEQDASVLLLGVGYQSCSAFHLAEYRYCPDPPKQTYSCVVKKWGRRRWFEYKDVVLDDGDFEIIGKSMEEEITVTSRLVGDAPARLISLSHIVDFATKWMTQNRV
jgi:aminoglycoside 3-N-acetyltransferase